MRILGLDTATWYASVGILVDGQARAEGTERTATSHAVSLLSLIERTLAQAGLTLAELDAVAVSRGPGAFTGLRVGLSTAKGLAYATGAALVTVPTLEALAATVGDADVDVVALLDARKGELYSGRYRVHAGQCERLEEDRLTTLEERLATLPERCILVGDADVAYGDVLRARLPSTVEIRSLAHFGPSGLSVARLGAARLQLHGAESELAAEPDYLRPSEAEVNAITA